jgi:hypothetical protein
MTRILRSTLIALALQPSLGAAAVALDGVDVSRADVSRGTKAGQPNAVYWQGQYIGTDPDPYVRLQMLRDAMSGGG